MIDLGDGWCVEWHGPDAFTLIHGSHRYGFDAPMTSRWLWKTVHTVRLDIRSYWDPPHHAERISAEERAKIIQKAQEVRGGCFRKLVFIGVATMPTGNGSGSG